MKKIIIPVIILILVVTAAITTHLFGNLWNLVTGNGYFIPKESNVFTFNPTQWDTGNGDCWLFGEDSNYYYALNCDSLPVPPYFKLKKGNESAMFYKTDYRIWRFVLDHTGKEYVEQVENEYGTVDGKKEIVRQFIRTLHLPDSLPISILMRTWDRESGLQDSLWSIMSYNSAGRDSVKQSFAFPYGMWWNRYDWALTQELRWDFRVDGQMNNFCAITYDDHGVIPRFKNQTRCVYDLSGRLIERVESSSRNKSSDEEWEGDSTKVKYLYDAAGRLEDSIIYKRDWSGWEPVDGRIRYALVDSWHYMQTKLSHQFDLEAVYKLYVDTITSHHYADSTFIRLLVKDKETGDVLSRISLKGGFLGSIYYEDKKDMTSYTTGLHANREIVDNYFGYIVVADLNFDGKDDIALVSGSAVSSGPYYTFYLQTNDRKFIRDNYLTDVMTYFPNTIDSSRHQLTTYAHASAVSVCKSIYRLDLLTNKWRRVSKTFIGD